MGRTKRTRVRKNATFVAANSAKDVVALMKWMGTLNWKNISKIRCTEFKETGRGVTSPKSIRRGDVLMRISYKLLITYSTLSESNEFLKIFKFHKKLKIQELLATFLVIEKHKGKNSFWKYYIESLPANVPKLPWFSEYVEIEQFPEDLRRICESCRMSFEDSWIRIKESIAEFSICTCCETRVDEIINLELYIWAYVMVNTRGVYIDPDVVRTMSICDILLDEPNIGLCPLMDMFNHSDTAENKIEFQQTEKETFYQLKTFNNCKKYEQLLISYGRHDNVKLFAEYGFYLPRNTNDKIKYSPVEILNVLKVKLDKYQFSFLTKHNFLESEELFVSSIGVSFKLKGFIYVALNNLEKNYSSIIFAGNYDEKFSEMLRVCVRKLIEYKLQKIVCEYEKFRKDYNKRKEILNFLMNRIEFVKYLEQSINMFL